MDNITHTIIGLGVGELLHRSLPAEPGDAAQTTRHRLILTGCAVASNLPDLDLLLTSTLPSPLGYLLNHRGYTHTILWALPQALLLCLVLFLCWPAARRLLRPDADALAGDSGASTGHSRSGAAALHALHEPGNVGDGGTRLQNANVDANGHLARYGLAAAVLIGLALHLFMDFMNSYGLHPFAPFDGRWFYGDLVFIVEPFFWVVFGVPLAMSMRRPWLRYTWLGVLAAALLFFAAQVMLAWSALAVLVSIGTVLAALQWRAGPRGRVALSLALLLSAGFLCRQAYTASLGRERISALLQRSDPAAKLLDIAMTAYPSQPLCWNFVTVESKEGAGTYRLRRGLLDLSGAGCPAALAGGMPGAASDATAPASAGVELIGEETASLPRLRQLKRESCMVDAWLRFARMPALHDGTLSDYRFSSGGRGDFTMLQLEQAGGATCPQHVPEWTWPRLDLLIAPPH